MVSNENPSQIQNRRRGLTAYNIAAVYRRKVERLSEALDRPQERIEAANAIRGAIERIEIVPGEKWGETHATLHGDLATIVDWTAAGGARQGTGKPAPSLSLPVESGAISGSAGCRPRAAGSSRASRASTR